jgi:predicted MFS family arabinose efflux permease
MTPARTLTLGVAAHASAILPLLLLGTLAVSVREDLGFDEAAFGAIPAVCFGVAAVASPACGRLVEGFGGTWGLRAAAAIAAASMFGIALVSVSWWTLLPFVVLAGLALAVAQPASDVWLVRGLPANRHGIALGFKQASAGPGVGLVAGLAVPASAASIGWRGSFAVAAIGAVLVLLLIRRAAVPSGVHPAAGSARESGDVSLRPLLLLTVAGGLASISQAAFLVFAVSSAVAAGLSEATAGLLFAAASAAAFGTRLILGRLADRRAGGLIVTITLLLLASAGGYAVLATGHTTTGAALIGTPLIAATSWGWQGLFFLVVARTNPNAPARASGITSSGVLAGSVIGPVLFGIVARDDYTTAWWLAAAAAIAGAAGMVVSRAFLKRDLDGPRPRRAGGRWPTAG